MVEDLDAMLAEYVVTRVPFAMGGAVVWVSSEGDTEIDLVMTTPDSSLRTALLRAAGWTGFRDE